MLKHHKGDTLLSTLAIDLCLPYSLKIRRKAGIILSKKLEKSENLVIQKNLSPCLILNPYETNL